MSFLRSGEDLIVTVTGAAGQICYSLFPLLANGKVFGSDRPIKLRLLEIPPALSALNGVVMELEDLASPLVRDIVATSDPTVAFKDAHVIILVGAFPRRQGMQRRDLLAKNFPIFSSQARVIAQEASPDAFILVVGNPANTNALILSRAAPSIPTHNITALSRLDHNRSTSVVARKCGVPTSEVTNIAIWGNHSSSQYPDFSRAQVSGESVLSRLGGTEAIASKIIPTIQKRGTAVIDARGASSAMSAAVAIGDHLRSWLFGDEQIVSMAVRTNGSYEIDEGIWFSFPVRCTGSGNYEIVDNIQLDEFSKRYIIASKEELLAERDEATSLST